MNTNWTPSGPTIIVSTSGTLYDFTGQAEGVAKIENVGTSVGLITLKDSSNTLADRFSPVNPGATFFVAFGNRQDNVVITGATLAVTPGFMLKDSGYLDKSISGDFLSILQLEPFSLYLPMPGYVFQDAAGTISALNNDPLGLVIDQGGNRYDLQQSTAANRLLYREEGRFRWMEAVDVSDCMISVDRPALSFPRTRISALRITQESLVDNTYFISGNGNSYSLGYRTADDLFQTGEVGGAPTLNITPSPTRNLDFVCIEVHDGADSRFSVDNVNYVSGTLTNDSPTQLRVFVRNGNDPILGRIYGIIEFDRALNQQEINTAFRFFRSLQPQGGTI